MSKPRMYGMNTGYVPNVKADMRHHKKVYQHDREKGGINMSGSFNACRNCVAPKRHPGCHANCPEYLQEKAEYDIKKAVADKQKAVKEGLDAHAIASVYRAHQRRKGRWK